MDPEKGKQPLKLLSKLTVTITVPLVIKISIFVAIVAAFVLAISSIVNLFTNDSTSSYAASTAIEISTSIAYSEKYGYYFKIDDDVVDEYLKQLNIAYNNDSEVELGSSDDKSEDSDDNDGAIVGDEEEDEDEADTEIETETSSSTIASTSGTSVSNSAASKLSSLYLSEDTAQIIIDNIDKYGTGSGQSSTMTLSQIKNLGGIFEEYADYNNSGKTTSDMNYQVATVEEFQDVCEYVFGLMTIFGFDYGNNKTHHTFGCGSSAILGTSYSYYGSGNNKKTYSYKTIENTLKSASNPRRTNCNTTADIIYYKARITSNELFNMWR